MTKVTVTIEGNIEEVIATLQNMARISSLTETAPGTRPPNDASADAQSTDEAEESPLPTQPNRSGAVWNSSYVHTFWRHLSDTARQAMIRVSRSPSHTQKRAQLMHTLQLSQRELSGSLSSQGHSLNRLKRRRGDVDLPRPLTYDKVNDAYILDTNFAEALQEIGLN